MTRDEIRDGLFRALTQVAPEADVSRIRPNVRLRDQLDIDSMDLLNFVIGVHKEFKIEIPEADYPRLVTLDGWIDYVAKMKAQPQM
jgi:acyl carrier protein